MSKYVFVVGGVYSGTGKGIGAASIALLLKLRGCSVQYIKCDPYLNLNAGTMSPLQHGEVFLCDDGTETDLDLGHIERITGINMSKKNIFTNGMLYHNLLQEEIDGKFLGHSLQIVPHVTNKIQDKFCQVGKDVDVTIIEIGGTIGDFESGAFFEAIRQFKQKSPNDIFVAMVAPIIWNNTIQEFKTKPLQNAVRSLQSTGVHPDMLLCRVEKEPPQNLLDKVSDMTSVPRECCFFAPDVKSIYQVPIELYDRHVDDLIADKFHFMRNGVRIHKYRDLVEKYINAEGMQEIEIGIIGKYDNCDEAYLSLKEAIYHAGVANDVKVKIKWLSAEDLEKTQDMRGVRHYFSNLSGVIVPGGFDSRGVEGKIKGIQYAKEKKIPFLGICLGLQCAVIETARSIGINNANSLEFDSKTENPVIHYVMGQESVSKKSGTMRLGSYECITGKETLARKLYGKRKITERHRHRYEVNEKYVEQLSQSGFKVSGRHPETNLVEIMELDKDIHPFFIGTQAHPEFKSQLGNPNPLFDGLVKAALEFTAKKTI